MRPDPRARALPARCHRPLGALHLHLPRRCQRMRIGTNEKKVNILNVYEPQLVVFCLRSVHGVPILLQLSFFVIQSLRKLHLSYAWLAE